MDISGLVRSLLAKRGVVAEDAIAAFLNPDYELHMHSPFLLQGMERAVARLLAAIAGGERIAVYADFDCDGIPGAALLSDFFQKIGYGNFEVYLPHRDREGYGFHPKAISELAERGVSLIITVDVGTTAVDAVRFAKDKGVDVIVTDHHQVTGELPGAVTVLNPKLPSTSSGQEAYPFPDLCGAAVAFKLVQATLIEGRKRGLEAFTQVPVGWEKWLLDLVAIATVADLVPLVGENRVLAHFGLRVLHKSPRPGVNALVNHLRLRKSELTEDDIGFSIAPRINAASRMDEPGLAFRLLSTHDSDEAECMASELEELNLKRKSAVASVVRAAKKSVHTRFRAGEKVVIVGNPEWRPALLGLAANSIVGERGGIVCLWGRDAQGRLKGSCRSDGDVSVMELFAATPDSFEEYGGHAASCGFSVSHERVHTLYEDMAAAFSKITDGKGAGVTKSNPEADAELALSDVAWKLFEEVSRLAPFGMGNPKPVFRIGSTIVTDVRRFGKEKGHIEIMLECRTTGTQARAFDFFASSEDFTMPPTPGIEAFVLGTLERDSFRGGLAVRLLDVLPPRDTITV